MRTLINDFKADWIEIRIEAQRLKKRMMDVISWLKEPLK